MFNFELVPYGIGDLKKLVIKYTPKCSQCGQALHPLFYKVLLWPNMKIEDVLAAIEDLFAWLQKVEK